MEAQNTRKIFVVESKWTKLVTNMKYLKKLKYKNVRNKLDKTCEQRINVTRIRKKRSYYKYGKKS